MGQAKRRGTFEQRKAMAINKAKKDELDRLQTKRSTDLRLMSYIMLANSFINGSIHHHPFK